MRFNTNWIFVFEKNYAYRRVKQNSSISDIPEINIFHSTDDTSGKLYYEGDICNEIDGYWYNYPQNIALLNAGTGCYELQLFSNNKVGKLYRDIKGNETEIREFFENNKGNVLLIENRPGYRQIKPDFDSLMKFIEIDENIFISSKKYYEILVECRNINQNIATYKEKAQGHTLERRLNYLIGCAEKYTEQVKEIEVLFEELKTEKLEDYCEKISDEEAYGVIFALFYDYYLNGDVNEEFKLKFNSFTQKHPESIDYFCNYLAKGRFEKTDVLTNLKRGIQTEKFYSELANSILS